MPDNAKPTPDQIVDAIKNLRGRAATCALNAEFLYASDDVETADIWRRHEENLSAVATYLESLK